MRADFWNKAFLEERPSVGLSLFRPFVAFTVGAHLFPTFLQLKDNYLQTAFKEKNSSFFTPNVIALVDKSPDALVIFMLWLFITAVVFFGLGLFSKISCVLMVVGCYYFYALNSLHIGTLSYDILLVVLFLMCVSGYHGDSFSLDAIQRGDPLCYERKRPFFVQRLLQLQIASTYFYTALIKFTGPGNWLTDNPLYHLANSVPESVVKHFPFQAMGAKSPEFCYFLGIFVILSELSLPFLLFIKRTRPFAIAYGFFFHVMLVVTLHVPTIFFFLFPPQLCLFIDPESIVGWMDKKRKENEMRGQDLVIYDGQCHFCLASIRRLQTLDVTHKFKYLDYQPVEDVSAIDKRLTRELCHSQMQLLTQDGQLFGGFYAFRRLSLKLPLLYLLLPLLYFPGMGWVGSKVYNLIAKNRYLFHRKGTCKNNHCFR